MSSTSRATGVQWLKRDDVLDRPNRGHTFHPTMGSDQESCYHYARRCGYRSTICSTSHGSIAMPTCTFGAGSTAQARRHDSAGKRYSHGRRREDPGQEDLQDYKRGFVHIDIKCLPQMPDQTSRRYLFATIDRATHWAFPHIYNDTTDTSSIDFLRRLKDASPIKISKSMTDNGSQFTDRFMNKEKKPSGLHVFDKICTVMKNEYHLVLPGHP